MDNLYEANDFDPVFSPDGLFIIFTSQRDGNKEIYIMDNNGSNITNISKNDADDWNPRIYPDSKKVVFQSLRDGISNWEIYVMNIDGSSQRNLTNNPTTDYSFVILPFLPEPLTVFKSSITNLGSGLPDPNGARILILL